MLMSGCEKGLRDWSSPKVVIDKAQDPHTEGIDINNILKKKRFLLLLNGLQRYCYFYFYFSD